MMLKKIMIINWKFTTDSGDKEDPKEYNVKNENGYKIFTCNFNDKCILVNFIEEKIIKYKDSEKLILLHLGSENKISSEDVKSLKISFDKVKLIDFKGGAASGHPIYYSEEHSEIFKFGLLGSVSITQQAIEMQDEKAFIKKEIFEKIWDYYWNKLDLKYQKKNIINLWLPLAIDIQGLSEVQNDKEKADKYFEEIQKETDYLNSLKSFPKDDEFPRWNEIKQALNSKSETKSYADFNPNSIAETVLNTQTTFNSFKGDEAKYLEKEKDSNPNPNFLPNWLQEVVRVIEKKLEG